MSEKPSTENDPIAENGAAEQSAADAATPAADAPIAEPAVTSDVPNDSAINAEAASTLEPAAAPIVIPAAAPTDTDAAANAVGSTSGSLDESAGTAAAASHIDAAPAATPAHAEAASATPDASPTETAPASVEAASATSYASSATPAEPGDPVEQLSHTDADRAATAAAIAAMNDNDDTPWYDRVEVADATAVLPAEVRASAAPATDLADAPSAPPVAEPVIAPVIAPPVAEPVVAPASTNVFPTDTASAQPIFVQAPEPPRKRGNRGFSGVVALIATLIFAVVYLAAVLFSADAGVFTNVEKLGADAVAQLATFSFWTPVVAFFLGFWLLGAFINTAKWGYWVVFGLFVGLIALVGHAGGQVLQANPLKVTLNEGLELAWTSIFTLPGLVAVVLGRELPIWFGGWIARRGRGVIAANDEAQAEYQATIDAGPQLVQQ